MVSSQSFSRPVVIDPWPAAGIEVALEAGPDERRALAERFDLVALTSLAGTARLEREGDVIRLRGTLEAEVVQACVVSLEDAPASVREAFECRFAPPGVDVDDETAWDEDVEALGDARVDLGEVFAQQLGLALDPYPRAAEADALVPHDLGPNISFGQDEPSGGALAAALLREPGLLRGDQRAANAAPGRGRE